VPAVRRPNLRISRRGFVALAIAGIVLPTLLLACIGFGLVDRLFRFQNEILQNYSQFSVAHAGDAIERQITAEERDIASYLQLVSLADPFVPELELRRAELEYPIVEHAFLRRMDGTLLQSRRVAIPSDSCRAIELAESRARAVRIARRIIDAGSFEHILLANELHYYVGSDDGTPYHMVAFPARDAANAPRGVMGFFLSEERVRNAVIERILETTIHATEGRFAPEFGKVLTFVVLDDTGREVFTHRHDDAEKRRGGPRYLAQAELDDVFPGWRVRITYANASGFAWSKRILGLQTVLLALASGLVVLGTLFTIRFSLRQMELSRLKSHFVSNITHELKTPLAAIRLYTETLQQGRVHDRIEANRFLSIIHKETVRLTALINNILDFARIEDGRRRYTFAPASVGDVVREVADAYSIQLRESGCALNLDIQPDLPQLRIDRDAIGQAVLNLLDNAVKYSRDDKRIGVTVAVAEGRVDGDDTAAAAAGTAAQRAVVIRVHDRGVGIPIADQKRIFEAFYRVEKGLQHDIKGSGLGLAVVQHIAEAHGGGVTVESRPGEGSTFTLRLPLRDTTAEPPAIEPTAGETWQRSA
jgi:signal transduction histidine kinase